MNKVKHLKQHADVIFEYETKYLGDDIYRIKEGEIEYEHIRYFEGELIPKPQIDEFMTTDNKILIKNKNDEWKSNFNGLIFYNKEF